MAVGFRVLVFRGFELFWSSLGIRVQGFTVVVSTFFLRYLVTLLDVGFRKALDPLVGLGFGKP